MESAVCILDAPVGEKFVHGPSITTWYPVVERTVLGHPAKSASAYKWGPILSIASPTHPTWRMCRVDLTYETSLSSRASHSEFHWFKNLARLCTGLSKSYLAIRAPYIRPISTEAAGTHKVDSGFPPGRSLFPPEAHILDSPTTAA